MKDNWKIFDKKYDDIRQQLMHNRKVDPLDFDSFLNLDFSSGLEDSNLMPDFDIFKSRLLSAREGNEKVGIFADYDADGIPGAAFLYKALERIGIAAEVYVPSRDEGYGLSEKGILALKNLGCSLIITVDLGIRNIEEAKFCTESGIDLIITDHHLPGDILPEAMAVINPKLPGSKYKFKELCGAGVIYKLMFGLKDDFEELSESFLKWNLDLVAISTISDVVPLVGENRIIAKYGLMVLQKTKNRGLIALYKVAQIDAKSIGVYQVGFGIGPRLNAPGRLAEAKKSFDLLVTGDEKQALKIAQELNDENEQRQHLMEELIKDAEGIIKKDKLSRNKIITVKGRWAKGVIGPSASRLADKYSRPVIVFAEEKEMITGSARSIGSINIAEILLACKDLLTKCGGHSGAAGLSLKPENYELFIKKLNQIASDTITEQQLVKCYQADLMLDFNQVDLGLIKMIRELEPFGMGNPRPTFVTQLAKLVSPKFVGSTMKHLSSYIEHQNKRIKSIYFNCPYDKIKMKENASLDVLYSIDEEVWNGKRYLKINVIDMEPKG